MRPTRLTHDWADICVIRDVAYLRSYGLTIPGGPPIAQRLPWRTYVSVGEQGEPVLDPSALLGVVTVAATVVLRRPVAVHRVEDDAMHGRPPGRPANPFKKPARFVAYWLPR